MQRLSRTAGRQRVRAGIAIAVLLAFGLAAAWRWTALHQFADPQAVAGWLQATSHSYWAPVAIILLYVGANALLFPNTVLNFAVILVLGTVPGLPYALLGSVSAAVFAYALGRRYGQDPVRRLHSAHVDRVTALMRRGGISAIAVLRLLPVAPFTVVNLIAGAAGVKLRDFALGTVLGLLPGNLLVTAFGHQLRTVLQQPDATGIALMLAIVLGSAALLWQTRRIAMRTMGN